MVVFFTIPPSRIRWPWILVNQFNVHNESVEIFWTADGKRITIKADSYGWSYILAHRTSIELVLLDSGVERMFKKPNPPTDYPPQYEKMWYESALRLAKLFGKNSIIVTIPDFPDDYVEVWGREHVLWKNGKDNIERTVENVVHYWDKYCTKNEFICLVPVQGHYEQPESIVKSIKMLHDYGIIREAKHFGIANLCTTKKVSIIVRTVRIARQHLRDKWIHVFGPSLSAVRDLVLYVNSFDSGVPHSRRRLWLAKHMKIDYESAAKMTAREAEELMFRVYIEKLAKIVDPSFRCDSKNIDTCINESINVFRSSRRNEKTFIDLSRWINREY